tara:strand:- start:106 stop:555 length:450 start_codon:yes stop_codon:yes gene_type:complete
MQLVKVATRNVSLSRIPAPSTTNALKKSASLTSMKGIMKMKSSTLGKNGSNNKMKRLSTYKHALGGLGQQIIKVEMGTSSIGAKVPVLVGEYLAGQTKFEMEPDERWEDYDCRFNLFLDPNSTAIEHVLIFYSLIQSSSLSSSSLSSSS